MKNGTEYRVLIADSDAVFRARLKVVMQKLVSKAVGLPIKIYEAKNIREIKTVFAKRMFLVFVDYLFVLKEHKALEAIFKLDPETRQVLLISHKGGLQIREIIERFKKNKHLRFEDYILKDNYSLDFILELIRVFLDPIINKK